MIADVRPAMRQLRDCGVVCVPVSSGNASLMAAFKADLINVEVKQMRAGRDEARWWRVYRLTEAGRVWLRGVGL